MYETLKHNSFFSFILHVYIKKIQNFNRRHVHVVGKWNTSIKFQVTLGNINNNNNNIIHLLYNNNVIDYE